MTFEADIKTFLSPKRRDNHLYRPFYYFFTTLLLPLTTESKQVITCETRITYLVLA